MEDERIKISKDTQKFVADISEMRQDKYDKVIHFLENLKKQQEVEAELEHKRGWRLMWQRTPKPYLLMLGYLVFLAPVGSLGYQAFSQVPENIKLIYLITMTAILILPLCIVFYLSYNYINQRSVENEETSNENIENIL